MKATPLLSLIFILLLAACASTNTPPEIAAPTEAVPSPEVTDPTPTESVGVSVEETQPPAEEEIAGEQDQKEQGENTEPEPEPTGTPTPEPEEPFDPDNWRELPVIPQQLSEEFFLIYRLGQLKGNNPQAFSKVGDCNSVTPDFLGEFDLRPEKVKLGEYSHLEETIDYFAGSFGRESLAAKVGQSANSVMSPLHNDWKACTPNETPLDCEFRNHNPAFAIITLGANDATGVVDFENSMRRVIEDSIGNGVIPILSTKPDNTEGDHSINRTIAMLAHEYGLPLWNFWAVIQPLPDHGMITGVHLSYSDKIGWADFVTPGSLEYGWTMRNLSALQVLDAIREMVQTYETANN